MTVSMTTTGDSLPTFLESQSIPNVLNDSERLCHHNKCFMIAVSLIPSCFPFLVLWFAFSIIHKSRRAPKKNKKKNRESLGTLITLMTSGGHKLDMGGGRGPHSNTVLDFIIEYSVARISTLCV